MINYFDDSAQVIINSSDESYELDEQVLLKEIELCENEEDLQVINRQRISQIFKNLVDSDLAKISLDRPEQYKKAYEYNKQKMLIYIQIIKYFSNSSLKSLNASQQEVLEYETKLKQQETLFKFQVDKVKSDLEFSKFQISNLQKQLDKFNLVQDSFNGKINTLQEISLIELDSLEKQLEMEIQTISNIKTKKIIDLIEKNVILQKQQADVMLCIICKENKMNIIFYPCNHVSVCERCSANLDQCPFCRQQINHKEKIFLM